MTQRIISTLLVATLAIIALSQTPAQADFITGLKAYYDFNQSSGSTLPLAAGSGNAGVLNNMDNSDWVASQPNFGNALDFDGANDYVRIPDGYTNTVNGDNTHTVAFWVYPRSVANFPVILDAEDGARNDYFLELGATTKGYTSVGGTFRTYSGTPLSLNTWHQFVFTKTGAGNLGDLYLDGVKQLTFSGSINSTASVTSDFLLARFKEAGFDFNGRIDDLAFWDRDLSEAEVIQLYTAGTDLNFFVNPPAPAPEPSSLLLFAMGALGLVRHTRRRNLRA